MSQNDSILSGVAPETVLGQPAVTEQPEISNENKLPLATIDAAFLRFHGENPHIYAELVKLCRQARQQGHGKIGMKMLWEVMRWNLWLQVKTDDEEFRLNNIYTSRYARLIMKNEPGLENIFNLRALKRE